MKGEALEFTPGHCFSRSATNHLLLGSIVEKVTEKTVPEVLTSRLFEPLGLDDTQYRDDGPPQVSDAGFDGAQPHALFGYEQLSSTASDLFRWQRALSSHEVVSERSHELIMEPVQLVGGTSSSHGYGSTMLILGEHEGIGHGGRMPGYSVHTTYYPEFELSIVLCASTSTGELDELGRMLARAVMDVPEPTIQDLPLDDDQRAKYVGTYAIGCSWLIVSEADEHLVLDYEKMLFKLRYQGRREFVAEDDHDMRVTFLHAEGRIHALALSDHGTQSIATRID